MGRNVVEKILGSHLVRGRAEPGSEAELRIDQTLTQDATGTMAYLQLEAIGIKRVKTELSVSYVDHNTVQEGFENADDHEYLKSVAAKYGIKFSKAGNGICHQVHLERFGIPGKTLLGSDSHTPTAGGIGMIGIGAGGLDVAAAMGGAAFNITYPKVIKVELKGKLQPWVTAKDIILKVLEKLSTKGNVGCIIEYGGEGVKHLSVPERATITNMGAETGVTTSVFPSDSVTREFLSVQDRANSWREIKADSDARYNQVIEIDLKKLVPLAACPHSPGNIKSVKELSGLKVNQVAIGSCTNSSYKDIMTVARLLSNRKVSEGVSLGVSCGSRQVLNSVEQTGEMKNIVQAGARILESVCGFCIGNSFAPSSNSVSLRTSNRNFFGRSGTNTADIYLVSPVTAVAAALSGEIRDPQEYFNDTEYPEIDLPEKLIIDDSMIIEPSDDPDSVEIVRGPNISSPPETDKPGDSIKGYVTIKVGDKITTDHIMPAGSRLKYRSNIPKYSEFVFERHDPEFYKRAVENRDKGVSNIIVAGESYGQGSSREHAAICPAYLGVGAVIAKSIERIHKANLINFGIVPVVFSNRDDYEKINQGSGIEITDFIETLKSGGESIEIKTDTGTFTGRLELSDRDRILLSEGGKINKLKKELNTV